LSNRKTLVVIGPNYGDVQIAELCNCHSEVYLIEPLPEVCRWLRTHNYGNPNVHVIEAACGAAEGFAVLNRYNSDGVSSSIGEPTEESKQLYKRVDLSLQGSINVDVIDACKWLEERGLDSIETLLIDAQGMDLTILKTFTQWLSRSSIRMIQCEADGQGKQMYDGLGDNSEEGFDAFMWQFPQYKKRKLTGRVAWNPDIVWELI
jgi:FkbM family methyltransferase